MLLTLGLRNSQGKFPMLGSLGNQIEDLEEANFRLTIIYIEKSTFASEKPMNVY